MLGVIIPVYHSRDTLPKTLDSLVAQTTNKFIVAIVSDCDGENYSDIIDTYSARGLHLNYLSTDANGGPGAARQRGIDALQMCDYFMFVDADDSITPIACDSLYKAGKSQFADMVISPFTQEHNFKSNEVCDQSRIPMTWLHGKCYSRDFLNKWNIRFSDKIRYNEDGYFNSIASVCSAKTISIPEQTYIWRDNRNSITRQEGGEKFIRIAAAEVVKSFVYNWEFIYGLNNPEISKKEKTQLLAQIKSCYDWYLRGNFFPNDNDDNFGIAQGALKKCLSDWSYAHQDTVKIIRDEKNLKYLVDAPQGFTINKKTYFFDINIQEWLKEIFPLKEQK